ncbi:MAG TPA: hypothetical protein ENL39_02960 [Candidatus Aerophobetes bacterium]|uniref:Flagellar protein FlgJ N-terminal domain-containing protein n=1 Tax=Aerophobetes bacterium TaxID=2030807 RepID=A0A7V5M048_UNCAE|nr:hypothetical protein [Candidatus Aerophobetes bacterium]
MFYLDFLLSERKISGAVYSTGNLFVGKAFVSEGENLENLKRVCSQFEAIFLSYLFRQMKKTIPQSGLIEKEWSNRVYEEEFYNAIAQKIAETQSIGLARVLFNELKNKIEKSSGGENGGNKKTCKSFKKATFPL